MRLLALLGALLIFLQPALKGGYFIWYEVNKAQIIEEMCVNKDMPEMHCDGKCVLAKKLKATQPQKRDIPAVPAAMLLELEPVIMHGHSLLAILPTTIQEILLTDHCSKYVFLKSEDVFHPPRTIAS